MKRGGIKNRFFFKSFLWPLLFMGIFMGNAQNFNSEVQAIFQVDDSKKDMLDILGIAKNLTKENKSLRYELSVITSDFTGANSSKSAQSGFFVLKPYETQNLSRASASTSQEHRTILLLLIYDKDNNLLGTARKEYPLKGKKENKASYKKPFEGLQLKGMVTEKTKTKPGKDFYKIFYQKYRLSDSPGNKIIKIEEMVSLGRTTKLMVKIDDKILFQFYARPKLEYLEEMADLSLRYVNRYFENLKKRKEYITRY